MIDWQLAIIGGIAGAVVSSLQRIETTEFELTQSRTNAIVQAINRTLSGAVAGLLVIVASKSGLAFSIVNGNVWVGTLISFCVGIGESGRSGIVQASEALITRLLPNVCCRSSFIRLKADFDHNPCVVSHGACSVADLAFILDD